jgi:hypothetical protein
MNDHLKHRKKGGREEFGQLREKKARIGSTQTWENIQEPSSTQRRGEIG